jgi:hypothetical protein
MAVYVQQIPCRQDLESTRWQKRATVFRSFILGPQHAEDHVKQSMKLLRGMSYALARTTTGVSKDRRHALIPGKGKPLKLEGLPSKRA